MLKMIRDTKGVLLVIAIILFYFSIVSLLQAVALRNCSPPGAMGKAGELRAGVEMHGFTVTAYCPGSCCNGVWAGLTASGKSIAYYKKRNKNIAAVDPAVIPMGTLFEYKDREYLAVDIGSKIRGKRIDLLMLSHQATYNFGVKKNQSIQILSARPLQTARFGAGITKLTYLFHSLLHHSIQ